MLWPCSHEAVPPAIPRVNAPIVRGQGLRVTIWKGCRGGRVKAHEAGEEYDLKFGEYKVLHFRNFLGTLNS